MIDSLRNNAACVQSTAANASSIFVEINALSVDEGYCLNSLLAPVFFISFVLIAQFVLMNVVIAVLMKQLEEANKEIEDDRTEEEARNKSMSLLREAFFELEFGTFCIEDPPQTPYP